MVRSKAKKNSRRSPRGDSPAPSHTSHASHLGHDDSQMVISEGLETSAWFPFFILAFASLGTFFTLVAYSFPRVQAGDYRFVPLLLAGVGGMVLSPVIGHMLSNIVLGITDAVGTWLLHPVPAPKEEDEEAGVARGLVLVLAVLVGVVAWLAWTVRELRGETATLRREIAYVALRDAQAHEKAWF